MILLWGGPTLLGVGKPLFYPILYPINWISYSTGIYMTVLLTLERYYAVCVLRGTPNLKKTKIVILCVCIFAILYNFPHFFEEKWDSKGIYIIFFSPKIIFPANKNIAINFFMSSCMLFWDVILGWSNEILGRKFITIYFFNRKTEINPVLDQ